MTDALIAAWLMLQSAALAPDDWRDPVMQAVSEGEFDRALAELDALPHRGNYEARTLRVRVLSWSGRHAEAREALAGLMADYPDNAELLTLDGLLDFYQGRLDAAEGKLERAVLMDPASSDAREALDRVRQATRAAEQTTHLRLDTGVELSRFSRDGMSDWQTVFGQLTHVGDRVSVGLRHERYSRFGFKDDVTSAQMDIRLDRSWTVRAGLSDGPGNVFRPQSGWSAGVTRTHDTETPGFRTLSLTAGLQQDSYAASDVTTVHAEARLERENLALTARLVGAGGEDEDMDLGAVTRIEYAVRPAHWISFGLARAPETVAGQTVLTTSAFGGWRYDVSPQSQLRVDCLRDDREGAYIRHACSVSVSRRF